jgi:mannosyltransferase OCH1-like enzyme
MTWDARAARALAARDFPVLLPIFDGYGHPVQRADAARWMALYVYGGVYADTDVECFAPVDASLTGADLVFNCEAGGGVGARGTFFSFQEGSGRVLS